MATYLIEEHKHPRQGSLRFCSIFRIERVLIFWKVKVHFKNTRSLDEALDLVFSQKDCKNVETKIFN